MKALPGLLAICLLACTAGTSNGAQEPRPCADDIAQLCGNVKAGGGRIADCLKQHEKELSAACREHVAKVRTRVREAKKVCHDDVMKLCAEVKPGGGRIIKCLKEHEADLSAECKEQLSRRRGR